MIKSVILGSSEMDVIAGSNIVQSLAASKRSPLMKPINSVKTPPQNPMKQNGTKSTWMYSVWSAFAVKSDCRRSRNEVTRIIITFLPTRCRHPVDKTAAIVTPIQMSMKMH